MKYLISAASLLFSALALPAMAASFDCAAARAPVELLICRNDELSAISKAAACGRVQALLIEDGREVGGTLDRRSGEILGADVDGSGDGVLDDVSELVLANGGQVHVLPRALMPTAAGVAAIFRY